MSVEEFIESLRLERLRRRIRATAVAAEIGVRDLSSWENHKVVPGDSKLRAWAAALGVEVPAGVVGYNDDPAQCGTVSGYRAHIRRGEPRCQPCKTAQNAALRAWRKRQATS